MSKILVVTSSASGEASVSNRLVRSAVESLHQQNPAAGITRRDLDSAPLPHLTAVTVAGFRGEPATAAEAAARALSDAVIAEVQAADTLVIGAPMYNFGIPSTLKAWFDHLLRAGITFRYTENGPLGLLKGKRAIVMLARGGFYSDGPAKVLDAQEPHLRALLGFVGIDDVTFIRAERLAMGEANRSEGIAAAEAQLGAAVLAREDRAA